MSRNIVICCDGTNNQFGRENTNVVRLIQVMDRQSALGQRLYYDPGVGTLPEPSAWSKTAKWFSTAFGLAFGGGIFWKVQQAYAYLMEQWEPGDRVYLFGFSRGAYTARLLAAVLHQMGLLAGGNQNQIPYLLRLFSALPRTGDAGTHDEGVNEYFRLAEQFRWTFARPVPESPDQRHFRVRFFGIWDTVSSVGWLWDPRPYPFTARNPSIDIIRHAVSIDERRPFFRQNLVARARPDQDIEEHWFPGVHSDVGGGYPESGGDLWRCSFEWMLCAAVAAGLAVDQQRLTDIHARHPLSSPAWLEPQHVADTGMVAGGVLPQKALAVSAPAARRHHRTRTPSHDSRGRTARCRRAEATALADYLPAAEHLVGLRHAAA